MGLHCKYTTVISTQNPKCFAEGPTLESNCIFSLFGLSPTLSYLFDPSILHLSNKENILLVICHTITAANGSIALWYFVKRAKQCLGEFSGITVPCASKRYKSRSGIHQSGAIGATGDLISLETRGNLFQK